MTERTYEEICVDVGGNLFFYKGETLEEDEQYVYFLDYGNQKNGYSHEKINLNKVKIVWRKPLQGAPR